MRKISLKSFLLLLVFTALSAIALGQVPEGFNYMAIARDGENKILPDEPLQVLIEILDEGMNTVYDELHDDVTTNADGLFQIVIGQGDPQDGGYVYYFKDIDWTAQPLYVKTTIDYKGSWLEMGSAQLFSVPYAMVSKSAYDVINSPIIMNEDTVVIMNSVDVVGNYPVTEEEALFEVKRQDGQTMFAVYNQGVRINIPMVDDVKGPKGGFAIGGFGSTKGSYLQTLFTLNKDSARIYLDKTPDLTKGAKGGFAIGGFDIAGKAEWPIQNYLFVAPDSARIYVKEQLGKGAKGGFAIGGFGVTKGSASTNFMDITPKNYFIGHQTGAKTGASALYNSVMGYQAAKNLSTGSYNTVIGYLADTSLTSGESNIIIGASAGRYLTTGIHNTLIGNGAGLNHTSNDYNVMIGTSAGANLLATNYSGSFNTFIGINAGNKIKWGKDNVFLGTNAGAMLEKGNGNTIVGIDAGRGGPWDPGVYHTGDSTTNNTIIGNGAGYQLAVGHGNVLIGYHAGYNKVGTSGTPSSDELYIANSESSTLIYGNFASGRIGLGTLSPAYKLDVVGDINITGDFRVNGSPLSTTTLTTGNLTASGAITVTPTRQVIGGAASITIADASTSTKGAVQLSDSYSGTGSSKATTEKALSDGLATKVTGAGMTVGGINLAADGNLVTIENGHIVLFYDYTHKIITLTNNYENDVGYWFKILIDKDNQFAGNGGLAKGESINIEAEFISEFAGYEIHFGDMHAGTGWCSVWLQYLGGRLVGHYIKY
jgi:hypothetical protein